MSNNPSAPVPPPGDAARAVDLTPLNSFHYDAQTMDGLTLQGTIEAPSAAEAQTRLAGMQLRVLSVEPATSAQSHRHSPIGPDDFLVFNQQLAHLSAAGLPVERGLQLIAADMNSGRLSRAATEVAEELERGQPLAEAFARHASRFPPLYGRLIDAGVQSGNLPAMLFNLGHHLALVAKLRQTMWRTLSYPIAVLAALFTVLLFVSAFVLPKFVDIFRDFRTSLPALTVGVMAFGRVVPYILLVVAVIVLIGLLIMGLMRASGRTGLITDTLLIGFPLIGPILRASLLARWIDALRLGIDAGLDLPRAIGLASESTASPRLTREGQALAAAISSGQPPRSFAGSMIPATVPAAIDLGVHSGDLPATLATLTRMYQYQAEHRLRLLPTIITPLALAVIACTVGTTIAALFLPLVKLIQSVSGGD